VTEVALAEYNNEVKVFPADRTDQPFSTFILPRERGETHDQQPIEQAKRDCRHHEQPAYLQRHNRPTGSTTSNSVTNAEIAKSTTAHLLAALLPIV
jgi:hypothetical protein